MNFSFDKDRIIHCDIYGASFTDPTHIEVPVRWKEGEEDWGEHAFTFEVDICNVDGQKICYVGLFRYDENDTKWYQVITEDTFFDILQGIENVIDFNKCDCKYIFKAANPFEEENNE